MSVPLPPELEGVMSQAEYDYAHAYAEALATGDTWPDDAGLDPERVAAIRGRLQEVWRQKVRRIYRQNWGGRGD